MKVEMQKLDGGKVLLEIEVPVEEVNSAYATAYRNIAKKVNIPGFRKGKAPKQILNMHIGKEAIKEEAFRYILPKAYYKAIEENNVEPVDQPDIDLVNLEEGQACTFKATVQGLPDVELGNYKELDIVKEAVEVTDEAVNAELEAMQKKNATLVPVEDRTTIQEGDTISLDFAGFMDGEPIEGGSAEGYALEIGSHSFIPGFEEQLVGMNINEDKEIEVTFPSDYHKEDLAGKDVIFKVKAHDIKVSEAPALDDDFAKDQGEFETLDALKADIKEKLQKQAELNSERVYIEKIIDAVVSGAKVELPQVMIDNEARMIQEEFEERLKYQGFSLAQYQAVSGANLDKLKEQFAKDGERRAKTNLVLESIAKAEGFKADDAAIDEEIESISKVVNKPAAEIKKYFLMQGDMAGLKREILRKKALEFLQGKDA